MQLYFLLFADGRVCLMASSSSSSSSALTPTVGNGLTLTEVKLHAQAKAAQAREAATRHHALIVLITQYLQEAGYTRAVTALCEESRISRDEWSVADNVDLTTILDRFIKEFTATNNAKPPKLVRAAASSAAASTNGSAVTSPSATPPTTSKHANSRRRSTNSLPPIQTVASPQPSLPTLIPTAVPRQYHSAFTHAIEQTNTKRDSSEVLADLHIAGVGSLSASKASDFADHNDVKVNESDPPPSLLLGPPPSIGGVHSDMIDSIMRDLVIDSPNTSFDSIVGHDMAKAALMESVVYPMKYPALFSSLTDLWSGVLLYGPSGTGKTLLARAVATECRIPFFHISAASIISKFLGESERLVKVLFQVARHYAPAVIFIDECESLLSQRNGSGGGTNNGGGDEHQHHDGLKRVKTELLVQLDGLVNSENKRVFLLCASNLPWDIDHAFLRRIDRRILVDLPDVNARKIIMKRLLQQQSSSLPSAPSPSITVSPSLNYEAAAAATTGYSGSDLKALTKEIRMSAIRRIIRKLDQMSLTNTKTTIGSRHGVVMDSDASSMIQETLTDADVTNAIDKIKSTHNTSLIQRYRSWTKEHGTSSSQSL